MIRKLRSSIGIFVVLSLALHFVVMVGVLIDRATPTILRPAPVEVQYVSPEEAADLRAKQKREHASKIKPNNQVVEQKDRINDEVDLSTRFLSAFNQKVIRQTRAERSGKFANTALGGKPDEGRRDGEKSATAVTETKHHKASAHEAGEMPKLRDLTPKFSLNPGPKAPAADKMGDPSQTDDYLKDVQSGMQTLLSTREFVYYTYYARIKEAIRQHWEPTVREKVKIIYRQGRTIASAKDRVTQVMVTLNSRGELVKVEVLTQSGVEDLDSAAIEAFRAASPFPNPPKGMVETDGTIHIRWDFVLEA